MILVLIKIIIGAIFCQVDKIIHSGQDIFLITAGNQKWHGAAPNLIKRAAIIMIEENSFDIGLKFVISSIIYLLKAPNNSKPDPIAWARKYLIAASVSRLFEKAVIKGIKDKRFSSRPIQI